MTPARRTLRLGPGFEVPIDAATESWGLLGQRGSGKSNGEVVIVEELHDVGVPSVTIDPKGDWWGIRSSEDGTGPGLPIPILGGLHGDLPLEPGSGAMVAHLLVSENMSAVLDISRMTGGELARFLIPFCHTLFDLHQADPHVRVVIFEEAHRYIPQQVTTATAALKEACAKIPLEGRAFGLGSITASQRSSRLHKDVLTQFSIMLAMRSPAKLDRTAIGGWTEEHEVGTEVLGTLAELDNGEAWCWSPHALKRTDRVRFRRRRTFDSGATPKVGQKRLAVKTLADIDLGAIGAAMAETVERAKENDPAELRKRVRVLEADLRQAQESLRTAQEAAPAEPVVEYVVHAGSVDALKAIGERLGEFVEEMAQRQHDLALQLVAAGSEPVTATEAEVVRQRTRPSPNGRKVHTPRPAPQAREQNRKPAVTAASTNGAALPGAQRKLLTVLATYGTRTKRQLAMQAGYAESGGGFNNPLGAIRSAGYVDPPKGEPITITDAGLAALGDYDPLPTGDALLEHWLGTLPGAAKKILTALVEHGPMDKVDLAAATGYEPTGGGFNNPLGRLRTLGLVNKGGDPVALTADFAEAIA